MASTGKYPPGLHRALTGLKTGGLHRALGVPEDKDIPADKMAKALKSSDPHVRAMAHFAKTMESWDK